MQEILFRQRWQLHKAPSAMAEPAQLVLDADLVGHGAGFKDQLEDERGNSEENEE